MTPDRNHSRARRPRRLLAVAALLATCLVLALAGCGSSGSSSAGGSGAGNTGSGHVHLAKTKFALHAGLAFGAFHHFIWKPFRAGDFSHPLRHKLELVKAGLAAVFIDHELKLALHDAQSSPTLSRLLAPITALDARLHGLGSGLKHGSVDSAGLAQDNGSIGQIESQSGSAGQPITEQTPSHL